MKTDRSYLQCLGCGVSRRQFLSGCARCAAAAGALTLPAWSRGAEVTAPKMKIRIIYALHAPVQPGPDWPNKGFDFRPVMEGINTILAQRCPDFQFVASLATGPEQAKEILAADESASIDGYIVYQMNAWNRVVQTIATSGKPVLYVDFKYGGSGGFLVYNAAFLRQGAGNIGFVSSSSADDLVEAVKCFGLMKEGLSARRFGEVTSVARRGRTPFASTSGICPDPMPTTAIPECMRQMKESRILAVRGTESGWAEPVLGISVYNVAFAELNDAWKSADKDQTGALADRWQRGATDVTDVTRKTLEESAAMYLAQKALLKKYIANAITIDCLGGFYGGHIHAYPCLGFHQLLNEGMVGACEADVRSTSAMIILTILSRGRPGYISDPVIDTSKREIVYAHCVASNKPFGPRGKASPFEIMTHSEDRQGASVRSILPVGYITTTVQFDQKRKEVIMHRARTVANDLDDRACRTKLCAEPIGDIEKLFRYWDQSGWHRVTCYGDFRNAVMELAATLELKVVEEA